MANALTMQSLKKTKQFLLVISSLITRLWFGLDLARLWLPAAGTRIARSRKADLKSGLPVSSWILSRNMLYCLNVDEKNKQMVIAPTPPIELN